MDAPLTTEQLNSEIFTHVRVILGVVTSLAIARILNGLARFAQNRRRNRPFLAHTLWAVFLLLLIAHFWWFEFALARVPSWPFEAYAFLIFFASLHFFTAALLFPDDLDEGESYEDYYFEHRAWFFGFLSSLFVFDLADTALKGWDYFLSLGPTYPVQQLCYTLLSLAAIRIESRRFHIWLSIAFILIEASWIIVRYTDHLFGL